MSTTPRRIAIVHDFLYTYSGAERVLEQMLNVYPDADLFSLIDFLPAKQRGFIRGKPVKCSFIQKLPMARTKHRGYLPLMPMAIEQLDVSQYDIVVSSSYLAAKGVITRPDQLHVCYCHTPVRFAWDLQHQYLAESGLVGGIRSFFARMILHYLRIWDVRSANGVDVFATNSHYVSRRVQKTYRRSSTPIYPPVDVEKFTPRATKDDFYVTASRFVPYKRIDLIVEAFNRMPEKRLIVIGDGPDFKKVKAKAGANVTLMGHQPFEVLRDHLQRAKAFVFAAEEDFGIAPVEAQACGTPVIAFGRGGATETVMPGVTGVLFGRQTAECIADAVEDFELNYDFDPAVIRENAERFSAQHFRAQFESLVESSWSDFHGHHQPAAAAATAVAERLAASSPSRGLGLSRAAMLETDQMAGGSRGERFAGASEIASAS
jgi:glycosyltransferase involved in cell wall biosynthesis